MVDHPDSHRRNSAVQVGLGAVTAHRNESDRPEEGAAPEETDPCADSECRDPVAAAEKHHSRHDQKDHRDTDQRDWCGRYCSSSTTRLRPQAARQSEALA